jgi:endonuclease YncB( thermonuclease family)
MRRIIGGQAVRCELNDERSHERVVCVCRLPDGTDTGTEIIRPGLALDAANRTIPDQIIRRTVALPARRNGNFRPRRPRAEQARRNLRRNESAIK